MASTTPSSPTTRTGRTITMMAKTQTRTGTRVSPTAVAHTAADPRIPGPLVTSPRTSPQGFVHPRLVLPAQSPPTATRSTVESLPVQNPPTATRSTVESIRARNPPTATPSTVESIRARSQTVGIPRSNRQPRTTVTKTEDTRREMYMRRDGIGLIFGERVLTNGFHYLVSIKTLEKF
jgi:hypothetical protein